MGIELHDRQGHPARSPGSSAMMHPHCKAAESLDFLQFCKDPSDDHPILHHGMKVHGQEVLENSAVFSLALSAAWGIVLPRTADARPDVHHSCMRLCGGMDHGWSCGMDSAVSAPILCAR
jgi:hypothetical protein